MCQQTYAVYIYKYKLYCVILWYVPISQTLQWCSLSTQRCKKPISVLNNSMHCFFKSGEPQESSNICRVRKWGFTLRGLKFVPMGSPSKSSYHLKQPFFFLHVSYVNNCEHLWPVKGANKTCATKRRPSPAQFWSPRHAVGHNLLRLRQTLVLRFGRTQEHYHLNGIGQDHHRDRAQHNQRLRIISGCFSATETQRMLRKNEEVLGRVALR